MEPIEVELAPGYKMLMLILALVTCGVGWVALWATARSWPKVVDGEGITTRGGKRVFWTELDAQQRVSAVDHLGRRISGRLDLVFGKTRVAIVPQSIVPAQQVMDVLSQVLGGQARTG